MREKRYKQKKARRDRKTPKRRFVWAWYPGIKWKVHFRQKNAEDALSKKGSGHPGLAIFQSVSLRWYCWGQGSTVCWNGDEAREQLGTRRKEVESRWLLQDALLW